MATIQDFRAALAEVDAETNRIAAVITDLVNKISAGGLTADEEAEALAGIQSAANALKAVGATPPTP